MTLNFNHMTAYLIFLVASLVWEIGLSSSSHNTDLIAPPGLFCLIFSSTSHRVPYVKIATASD